jgi:hypothetical protein
MSPAVELNIPRYWSAESTDGDTADPFGLSANDAFGFDDQIWYHRAFRDDVQSLAFLTGIPCLFLLGEPGLGKSTAVRQEVQRLEQVLPDGERVLRIDLAEVSSDAGLDTEFNHDTIQAWRNDGSVLHLFLDSYDESLRRYPTLKPRLLAHLREFQQTGLLGRMRLRIACRSGDFPGHLEDQFETLWVDGIESADQPVRKVHLERLSRSAVRAWADAKDVPPDDFLGEVNRRNAAVFASHPITLNALLAQFQKGALPNTEVELYEARCLELCEESNPNRQEEPELSSQERLAVAEQIAVLMTLSNKTQIWRGPLGDTPDEALHLSQLVHESPSSDEARSAAELRSVKEVLVRTALFTIEDASSLRWSQETYREFLVARFFAHRLENKLNAIQFLEHPGQPGSTERWIAPQLAQPASWLAAINEDVARWLVEHDPATLLRGQHEVPESLRPQLTAWLLEEESAGHSLNIRWDARTAKASLDHPGISDLLALVVRNHDANDAARWLACWLAGLCRCTTLEGLLLEVALDADEPSFVRWSAVLALTDIGIDETKRELRPLLDAVEGDSGDDHQLRAQLMVVTWPEYLSTTEALDYLQRHQNSFTDEYTHTFDRDFASRLEGDQLIEALAWIQANPEQGRGALRFLIGDILTAGAAHLDDDGARTALADALSARLEADQYDWPGHQSEFIEAMRSHPESLRMEFANALVERLAELPGGAFYAVIDFLAEIELPYPDLLAQAKESELGADTGWWRVIQRDQRTWNSAESYAHIQEAALASPAGSDARASFERLLGEIEERRQERAGRRLTEEINDVQPRISSRAEEVEAQLARADTNPIEAWRALGVVLNREDDGSNGIVQYHLATTPGWLEASAERQGQILEVARRFLHELAADPEALHPDLASVHGYQAAALIAASAPTELDDLTEAEWGYWVPLFAQANSNTSEREPLSQILRVALAAFPEVVVQALIASLHHDAKLEGAQAFLTALGSWWSDQLTDELMRILDGDLSASAFEIVLSTLLGHSHEEAVVRAMACVQRRVEDRERAVVAARQLLVDGNPDEIEPLIQVLREERDFARETFQSLATSRDAAGFPPPQFIEPLLADLYVLVADLFPPGTDPEIRSGAVTDRTPEQMVAELRNRLLWRLMERGTWTAVDELQRIIGERPDLPALRARWHSAVQATLLATWQPFNEPGQVLQVVDDERRRILRNANQLLTLVKESLGRLQNELTERGAAVDLWSEWAHGTSILFRPKREVSLSDYLKRFLDRDLSQFAIVTNREVENVPLNRTDLLVQSINKGDPAAAPWLLQVVVEVKAAWHRDVRTAIENQLANRYLKNTDVNHGIYLVLWFDGEGWDPDDSRRGKAVRRDSKSLHEELARKADHLSSDHRAVEIILVDASLRPAPPKKGRESKAAA